MKVIYFELQSEAECLMWSVQFNSRSLGFTAIIKKESNNPALWKTEKKNDTKCLGGHLLQFMAVL